MAPETAIAGMECRLGRYAAEVDATLARSAREGWGARLWANDPTLWRSEPAQQRLIVGMLGWLRLVETMRPHLPALAACRDAARADGIRHVVLLGMGGSSLCPEVLQATFGSAEGHPSLIVLDSTDPATIRSAERSVDLARTLFLVASKSGTTIEPDSLMRYFWERVRVAGGGEPGRRFLAITDPGTALARRATEQRFRQLFLNPPDVGGRYSAFSLFGLVPAALIGVNLERWLGAAASMAAACGPEVEPTQHPGLALGVILGVLAQAGRDKVTLVAPPTLATFGLWVEQLLAESLGKEGRGLLPVAGETLGAPEAYGADRLFVALSLDGEADRAQETRLERLAAVGHPVLRIRLADRYDLAGECFRWEVATAIAGACLRINPFDQPNVQEAKERTSALLQAVGTGDATKASGPHVTADGYEVTFAEAVARQIAGADEPWAAWWRAVRPGMYVAVLAYVPYGAPAVADCLERLRHRLRDGLRVAVTWGYGPRYLHSTGQLHKGGPNTGYFFVLLGEDEEPLPIPERPFTFGQLKAAQAWGDFASLADKGRRVALVRLRRPLAASLEAFARAVTAPFPQG